MSNIEYTQDNLVKMLEILDKTYCEVNNIAERVNILSEEDLIKNIDNIYPIYKYYLKCLLIDTCVEYELKERENEYFVILKDTSKDLVIPSGIKNLVISPEYLRTVVSGVYHNSIIDISDSVDYDIGVASRCFNHFCDLPFGMTEQKYYTYYIFLSSSKIQKYALKLNRKSIETLLSYIELAFDCNCAMLTAYSDAYYKDYTDTRSAVSNVIELLSYQAIFLQHYSNIDSNLDKIIKEFDTLSEAAKSQYRAGTFQMFYKNYNSRLVKDFKKAREWFKYHNLDGSLIN